MKNYKGITLIALVVTIVVLLILASISIGVLTGENGIIAQAQEAKKRTEEREEEEKSQIEELQEELGRIPKIEDETPGELSGKGTEKEPYLIESIEDLIMFSQKVNEGESFEGKEVRLNQTLDFNSENSYKDHTNTELFGDYNGDGVTEGIKEEATKKTGRGFIPIGKEAIEETSRTSYSGNFFEGTFDGNNKVIGNIFQQPDATEEYVFVGMFGGNLGVIKNLSITGDIRLKNKETENELLIAGLTAYNTGDIQNCCNGVNILVDTSESYWYIGGISGFCNSGYIEKCDNIGQITIKETDSQTGGIVGWLLNSNIKECSNKGPILSKSESNVDPYIGGIIGYGECDEATTIEISSCSNFAKITTNHLWGGAEVGGIAGMLWGIDVRDCYNLAEISSYSGWVYIGGVFGEQSDGNITNCYNKGDIKATISNEEVRCWLGAGGVGGLCYGESNVENCYNLGKIIIKTIDGWSSIGGVWGEISKKGKVKSCFNIGDISIDTILTNKNNRDNPSIGGFSGTIYGSEESNCYNLGDLKINNNFNDKLNFGAFVGSMTNEIIQISNCYTAGNVNVNSEVTCRGGEFFGWREVEEGKETPEITIDNCYYKSDTQGSFGWNSEGVTITNSGNKTADDMKKQAFVDLLNNGTDVWQADKSNKNKGFPILNFQ